MKPLNITHQLHHYLWDISLREHPLLRELRESTASWMLSEMQISPDVAQFIQWLLRLTQAKKVLEIGTFRGYSTLAMALVLPEDGHIITCDNNAEWTKTAVDFWQKAKLLHRIELRLSPALKTLQTLMDEGQAASFDFIFIDADKTNYLNYYEFALKLIKPTGFIAIDNIFWSGKIIDASDNTAQTRAIRALNDHLKQDHRIDLSLLTIGDGLFLIKPSASHA